MADQIVEVRLTSRRSKVQPSTATPSVPDSRSAPSLHRTTIAVETLPGGGHAGARSQKLWGSPRHPPVTSRGQPLQRPHASPPNPRRNSATGGSDAYMRLHVGRPLPGEGYAFECHIGDGLGRRRGRHLLPLYTPALVRSDEGLRKTDRRTEARAKARLRSGRCAQLRTAAHNRTHAARQQGSGRTWTTTSSDSMGTSTLEGGAPVPL